MYKNKNIKCASYKFTNICNLIFVTFGRIGTRSKRRTAMFLQVKLSTYTPAGFDLMTHNSVGGDFTTRPSRHKTTLFLGICEHIIWPLKSIFSEFYLIAINLAFTYFKLCNTYLKRWAKLLSTWRPEVTNIFYFLVTKYLKIYNIDPRKRKHKRKKNKEKRGDISKDEGSILRNSISAEKLFG
jgi:hypothetical protein